MDHGFLRESWWSGYFSPWRISRPRNIRIRFPETVVGESVTPISGRAIPKPSAKNDLLVDHSLRRKGESQSGKDVAASQR